MIAYHEFEFQFQVNIKLYDVDNLRGRVVSRQFS